MSVWECFKIEYNFWPPELYPWCDTMKQICTLRISKPFAFLHRPLSKFYWSILRVIVYDWLKLTRVLGMEVDKHKNFRGAAQINGNSIWHLRRTAIFGTLVILLWRISLIKKGNECSNIFISSNSLSWYFLFFTNPPSQWSSIMSKQFFFQDVITFLNFNIVSLLFSYKTCFFT